VNDITRRCRERPSDDPCLSVLVVDVFAIDVVAIYRLSVHGKRVAASAARRALSRRRRLSDRSVQRLIGLLLLVLLRD
jgi:hypothetical protein